MKKQENIQSVETRKVVSIAILYTASIAIVVLGACFSVYSFVYESYFTVLNSRIHGSIFGLVTAFLGIRYFLSVRKLKAEVYKTSSQFSWNNFRKQKAVH